jgi:hypothetical protein
LPWADRASILVFDHAGVMRFKAWRGISDEYRTAVEGHSPWTRESRHPQPVLVRDVEEAAGPVNAVVDAAAGSPGA